MGCGVICQYISAPQYRGNILDSNLIFVSGLTRVDLIQTLEVPGVMMTAKFKCLSYAKKGTNVESNLISGTALSTR